MIVNNNNNNNDGRQRHRWTNKKNNGNNIIETQIHTHVHRSLANCSKHPIFNNFGENQMSSIILYMYLYFAILHLSRHPLPRFWDTNSLYYYVLDFDLTCHRNTLNTPNAHITPEKIFSDVFILKLSTPLR